MKLTQKQIKQIIKEELQSVLGEQQQLDEGMGMVAAMAALLFGGGIQKQEDGTYNATSPTTHQTVEINGVEFDSPQELTNALEASELISGQDVERTQQAIDLDMTSPDGEYNTSEVESTQIQDMNAFLDAYGDAQTKSQDTKTPSGSADAGGRVNFDLQAVNLQNMMDTNPEQAKTDAAKLMKMDAFKLSSKATQAKIKQIAGIANLAR
jgi:hypothetical protein